MYSIHLLIELYEIGVIKLASALKESAGVS
jgi:hypothetical protein